MAKGHGIVLYLPDSLVLSLAQTQVNDGLGRSFAGLLLLTEGAFKLGTLSLEDYEELKARYSTPLRERPKRELSPVKATVTPTLRQIKNRTEIEELEFTYSNALNQWVTMKEKSKQYFAKKASVDLEKYPELKSVKLVLELAEQESLTLEG